MKTAVVLAMHGMTPKDFPADEKKEYFSLRAKLGESPFADPKTPEQYRLEELEFKLRRWPRHEGNDPFAVASFALAASLQEKSNLDVFVGFNEFCFPDIHQAVDLAVRRSARRIMVVTPMVTRGGNHSEEEIPSVVAEVQQKYPDVEIHYAWPYMMDDIADFLSKHLQTFLGELSPNLSKTS